MKTNTTDSRIKLCGLWVVVLLALLLSCLFWRSFLPDYVHFSNDGPLGAANAKSLQLPASFTGNWIDSSLIGGSGGASPLGPTTLLRWALGPVGYSKFLAPFALLVLGLGAWTFFHQLRLSPLAAVLGALATALNGTFFATACWGVASQQVAIGMDFFALALVMSNSPDTPALTRWIRLALAGMAVGVNVLEAADIGAIFSLFVAAFVLFKSVTNEDGSTLARWGRGVGRVSVIAIFAAFIALQTIASLVGSQIQGIAGTEQDTETKLQHWDWATQWSEPKIETLGLFVPGLFGYRMDTPRGMMKFLQPSYEGGNYWGGVGRDPALDRYLDSGRNGPAPSGFMRFTGGGNYCGVLVVLVALWSVAHSLRRRDEVFPPSQRRFIRFWAVVLIGCLLLGYGRFAPFYKFLYLLPYFSTIRNPTKFLIVFSWAIVILFAYGIDALTRCYLGTPAANARLSPAQRSSQRGKLSNFDQMWIWFCVLIGAGSLVGWLVYASQKTALVRYLQIVGFDDEGLAEQIATFSIAQAGWFVVLFALAAGLWALALAGLFAGKRARLGGALLGILLVADLVRADVPYVIHWDYKQKYASNSILDFLRNEPYEHRVAILPFSFPQQSSLFEQLYRIEWAQHQFLYYNIQSLDVVQMPRVSADLKAFESALAFRNTPETLHLITRRWQLTNLRYLLGPAGYLEALNGQIDPVKQRFRIIRRFDVVPKPGITQPTKLEELTAVTNETGSYALFDFTGALPRVKLYSHWQVSTNDNLTLKTLASTNFDAWQTVLVSAPLPAAPAGNNFTNENTGLVDFRSYDPKDIVFDAKAETPAVLLLNDKYDPHWQVLIDGKPSEVLRCNFIMRGVYLTSGEHTVEFRFVLSRRPFYLSLAAIGVALVLSASLLILTRRRPEKAGQP